MHSNIKYSADRFALPTLQRADRSDQSIVERIKRARRSKIVWQYYFITIIVTSVLLTAIGAEGMLFEHHLLGTIMLAVSLYPTARYFARNEQTLPAFELMCFAYGMQFAVPSFIGEPTMVLAIGTVTVNPDSKIAAQLLSIIGIGSMEVGHYLLLKSKIRHVLPNVYLPLDPKRALVYALVMGGLGLILLYGPVFNLYQWNDVLTWQAVIGIVRNQVNVAIAILTWLSYVKKQGYAIKVLLYTTIVLTSLAGLLQGTLEALLVPFALLLAVRWLCIKKIPWKLCLIVVLVFIFLQPVKGAYRDATWNSSNEESSLINKGTLWVTLAGDYWQGILTGKSDVAADKAFRATFQRADFIHLFAHTYTLTPEVVPYQMGDTYKFLLVTFVPRFLWPDKPLAQEANNFFAVAYGINAPEQIGKTMTGVSILIEAFINFGWLGVVIIMFLQGVIFASLTKVLNSPTTGEGGQFIYLTLIVYFLNGIGSNTAALFGGLIQMIIINYFLLRTARRSRHSGGYLVN